MNDNDGKLMMIGLLGLGIGLGVGILLSPRSGVDIRKEMKDKVYEAKSTADTIASRARKKWRELREEAKRDLVANSKNRTEADRRIDNLEIEL